MKTFEQRMLQEKVEQNITQVTRVTCSSSSVMAFNPGEPLGITYLHGFTICCKETAQKRVRRVTHVKVSVDGGGAS